MSCAGHAGNLAGVHPVNAIPRAHAVFDEYLVRIHSRLRQDGHRATCSKGCFACCREPVYAERGEVSHIVEHLQPQQRVALEARTQEWLQRFNAAGISKGEHRPDVVAYRAHMLWCPLLVNGMCSVYKQRPIACRSHLAIKDRMFCESDSMRLSQKFATSPEAEIAAALTIVGDSRTVHFDHLGILLGNELFGTNCHSAHAGSMELHTR